MSGIDHLSPSLVQISALVFERNIVEEQIATITGRPLAAGHLGEWIAARVFDIDLETSAAAKAIDGRFASGPLAGKTVNVKWYGKDEGLLDLTEDETVDFYLVMTGQRRNAASSRGTTRPLAIDAVYLFETRPLLQHLRSRGVKIGVASSLRRELWDAAQIHPVQQNATLTLSPEQRAALDLFVTIRAEASSPRRQRASSPAG